MAKRYRKSQKRRKNLKKRRTRRRIRGGGDSDWKLIRLQESNENPKFYIAKLTEDGDNYKLVRLVQGNNGIEHIKKSLPKKDVSILELSKKYNITYSEDKLELNNATVNITKSNDELLVIYDDNVLGRPSIKIHPHDIVEMTVPQ